MTNENPLARVDNLKGHLARLDQKIGTLEASKANTRPADLPALHRQLGELAETRAALFEALSTSEIVLRDAQEKFNGKRDECTKNLPQILGEVMAATARIDRGCADIKAGIEARNAALERLRPLMDEFVAGWQKPNNYRAALERSLSGVLYPATHSSIESLQNRDSLINSSCREEVARLANRKREAA